MKHLLAAASVLFVLSGAAHAQTPAQPVAAGQLRAAAPSPTLGVSPEALIAWLNTQNATAGPVQVEGERRFVRVQTEGLPWLLFLQSCEGGLCSDIQFSAGLTDAAVSLDKINGWNRDRRFVKAIYEPGEGTAAASAIAQYDVLLNAGDAGQLSDHLAIWRSLLPEFVRTVGAPPAR